MSRRTAENVLLYVVSLALYGFALNSIPPKLELFEGWVDSYLPILQEPWGQMVREFLSMRPNDSNQSVNAPIWLALIQSSLHLFGNSLLAYRLPGVVLTALAPVLAAEIVRRFGRANLAFLVGLLVGSNQYVIGFARTGGYIGPTLALFLAIVLFGLMIAFEDKRWPWIPLAICLAISPFFYSTIRYYAIIGVAPILCRLILAKDFRRTHLFPLGATLLLLVGVALALTEGGRLDSALVFISGRGEQFLLTDKTVKEGFEASSIQPQYRLSGVVGEMIPQRFADLGSFYGRGTRFFNYRYQAKRVETVWLRMRPWWLAIMALGVIRCLTLSLSLPRYLVPLFWSVWAWIPLLVTTGITPNRMLLGVPADLFILVLGAFVPVDLISRYLSEKWSLVPKLCVWAAVIWLSYHSASTYFHDYIEFPNL